jgi:hypothetical protein
MNADVHKFIESAEAILDDVGRNTNMGADVRIQLANAYTGLAAIKVTIETQEALRASVEQGY